MWRKKSVVFAALAAGLLLALGVVAGLQRQTAVAAGPGYPFRDHRDGVDSAAHWVMSHQNDDGGFTSFSAGANVKASDVNGTLDAMLAVAATGHNPAAPYPGQSETAVSYLHTNPQAVADYAAANGGQAGKLLLGLTAVNQNPRTFNGHNFVISLTQHLSTTGQFGVNDAFNQSLAMLGLTAVHQPVPPAAVSWLTSQQASDGSWDDGFGTLSNPDATAMAVMALVGSGVPVTTTALVNARVFLHTVQLPSGGWEYNPGWGESPNTTALVIQALAALGEDFYNIGGDWSPDGTETPLVALYRWQNSNGAYQVDYGQGRFDDFFATVQALPAANGRFFPLASRAEAVRLALGCLATLQDPATGGWAQFAGLPANAAGTAQVIEAIAAAGGDPQSAAWTTISGTNAVAALETLTPNYLAAGRGGRVGIVLQGVAAAGTPYTATSFADMDLLLQMSGHLSSTGDYDDTIAGQGEAMLGLLAVRAAVDETAVSFLQHAHTNGDWGDPDSNGLALSVLGRLGLPAPVGAMAVLSATQQADAGWGFGLPSSPSSSAEVAQGLVAHGHNPFAPAWAEVVGGRIVNVGDTIIGQQGSDGCWPNLSDPGADPSATTDAIILLAQNPGWVVYHTYLPIVMR